MNLVFSQIRIYKGRILSFQIAYFVQNMSTKKGLSVYNLHFSVIHKGFISKCSSKIIKKVIGLIIYFE